MAQVGAGDGRSSGRWRAAARLAALALLVGMPAGAAERSESPLAGVPLPRPAEIWDADPERSKQATLDLAAGLIGRGCLEREHHFWKADGADAIATLEDETEAALRSGGWTLTPISRSDEGQRIVSARRDETVLVMNWLPTAGGIGLLLCTAEVMAADADAGLDPAGEQLARADGGDVLPIPRSSPHPKPALPIPAPRPDPAALAQAAPVPGPDVAAPLPGGEPPGGDPAAAPPPADPLPAPVRALQAPDGAPAPQQAGGAPPPPADPPIAGPITADAGRPPGGTPDPAAIPPGSDPIGELAGPAADPPAAGPAPVPLDDPARRTLEGLISGTPAEVGAAETASGGFAWRSLLLIVFAVALAAAGWLLVRRTAGAPRPPAWPTTIATVEASHVEAEMELGEDGAEQVWYRPVVRYRYAIAGTEHQGERIRDGDARQASWAEAEAITARYPRFAGIEINVDPDDPDNAVIEMERPAPRREGQLGLACLAVAVVVAAAALI